MEHRPSIRTGRAAVLHGIAVLLVVLIACVGYAEAIHVHKGAAPDQGSSRAHCSLCVVTHSAAQITAAHTGAVLLTGSGQLASADPQVQSRLLIPTASIRPPPLSL